MVLFHLLLMSVIVGKGRIHVGDSEVERVVQLSRGQLTVALFDLVVNVKDSNPSITDPRFPTEHLIGDDPRIIWVQHVGVPVSCQRNYQ